MALVKQGARDPYAGKVMTTMGYQEQRDPLCYVCGQRKKGLFTVNPNGKPVCSDCAGTSGVGVLEPAVSEPDDDGSGS